jgi:hypothetical protein
MGKTASLANIGTIADSSLGFRNRIINGAMVINQRAFSGNITTAAEYTLDRWRGEGSVSNKFTVAQSLTAPTGFINSALITSSAATSLGASDYYMYLQNVEGLNCADLAWGTASAQTVTLSFWVYSSLTGTFGGAVRNSAANRSYPFTYTISAANTWEQKSITIAGDTSGTWLTTNGIGLRLQFGLGVGSTFSGTAGAWAAGNFLSATGATSVVGTNGATFYITGVQLEKGSTATSFDYRPYTTELQLAQRYLPTANSGDYYTGLSSTTTIAYSTIRFPVTARVAPTGISVSSVTGYTTTNGGGSPISVTAIAFGAAGVNASLVRFDVASGLTAGQATATAIGTAPLLFTGCEL